MNDIAEAAARGAAYFDEHEPGWFERIDAANLELSDPCGCIVGQLYGNFHSDVGRVGSLRDAHEFGLILEDESDEDAPSKWETLTAAWRDEIARRRLATILVNASVEVAA